MLYFFHFPPHFFATFSSFFKSHKLNSYAYFFRPSHISQPGRGEQIKQGGKEGGMWVNITYCWLVRLGYNNQAGCRISISKAGIGRVMDKAYVGSE